MYAGKPGTTSNLCFFLPHAPDHTSRPQALTEIGPGKAGIGAASPELTYVPNVMKGVVRSADRVSIFGNAAAVKVAALTVDDESGLDAEQL